MRNQAFDQDSHMVRMVRAGRLQEVAEVAGSFSAELPRLAIANTIDNAARDIAEQFAPLPTITCAAGNMNSGADQGRAAKRAKVASYYLDKSSVALQNIDFCDSVLSYRKGVYRIEPDFKHQCPRIRWTPSFDTYYYKDLWGHTRWVAQYKTEDVLTLCAKYEEHAPFIRDRGSGMQRSDTDQVTVVTYDDNDTSIVYLPDCGFRVLARWDHKLGRTMVAIAERPGPDGARGQFDDSVYPLLAKHIMVQYQMRAADESINAPIAGPDDIQELAYGPGTFLRTQNPQGVRRVNLDIPNEIFAVLDQLDKSVKEGSRYPESRTGSPNASIITGQGIEALAGTMNTQIRTMQTVVGRALEEVTELCFLLDVKLWPNVQKKITGVITGKPFEITYTPAKDIGESYTCKATYGFASGQTPAQAIVAMLQLRGDKAISRDTLRRNLPFDIDSDEEQRQIDAEDIATAATQGLMGLAQAVGPMVMQGQDPMVVLRATAMVLQARRKGVPIEDALIKAFTPPEPPPEAEAGPEIPGQPPGPEGPGGPQLPPGVQDTGLLRGQAPGQQGMAPGGLPDVQNLMATLRGQGGPRMEATVARRRAIGA